MAPFFWIVFLLIIQTCDNAQTRQQPGTPELSLQQPCKQTLLTAEPIIAALETVCFMIIFASIGKYYYFYG